MKQNKLLIFSISMSILLHVFFISLSVVWWIPGAEALTQKSRKMFDIKSIELPKPQLTRQTIIDGYIKKIKFQKPQSASSSNIKSPIIEISQTKPPEIEQPISEATPFQNEDSFLNLLKRNIILKDRVIDKESEHELNLDSAASTLIDDMGEDIEMPDEFSEQMFGFTPSSHSSSPSTLKYQSSTEAGNGVGRSGGDGYEVIDDYVQVRLETFRDPKDNQGYFRLAIAPGEDAGSLHIIPKEVIFLMDASLSIREKRLDQFVKGIQYALKNLNPQDKFNIYTFKDKITPLATTSMTATNKNIARAARYLNNLEASEQTDIYEAFYESIQHTAAMDPSYIIFLSDGRPTHGITSSAKLIGDIGLINQAKRSIFTFSGGRKVNRYMLDFLAYQNRGWSEYAAKNNEIGRRISELYDKVKNPLLVNVQYQFGGLDNQDIFPKRLPDFYLNTEFVVYGKYTNEEKFSMRFLGESRNKTKEFIFSKRFDEGIAGGQDIRNIWAFNKYYHLISQIALVGKTPKIVSEVRELSRKYNIKGPYDI